MRTPKGHGDGGVRGGRDGGHDFRGGGGRGGGRFPSRHEGPPSEVVEVSSFVHACEEDAVEKLTNEKISYFNASIYLQNKTQIEKVDEIFGPINESMMEGIIATSYSAGDKFYIDPAKLLPLDKFLPQPNFKVKDMDVCSTISLESDHHQNNGATSEHLNSQSSPRGSPPETPKDEQQSATSQQHQSSTPVSGPRCALTYSVVHIVMEKKEDGLGSRCGHTLTIVPAIAEEGSPNYIGPKLILFGGATALDGNSVVSRTPSRIIYVI